MGEGEFSPKTSELQISPLSSENKTQEGEQNAGKTPVFRNAFDFEDEDIDPGMPPQVEGPIWPAGSNIFHNRDQPEGGDRNSKFHVKKRPNILDTSRNFDMDTRESTPSERDVEQVSSSNSANFWTSVLKISGGNEEPKAHPPAPKRPREQSFQEALTPSKKFAPVTPQANFDAYMDTTGSAELQGGGNVVTETPLLSQSSNGVHPAQAVEPEDPHLWDEWAVDIENRIQDVREYMGAIEKVLLGRVEGMFDQNQRDRRNIDQKMAQIQQVLTEELETRIRQENPPMCRPAPVPDQRLCSAGLGWAGRC